MLGASGPITSRLSAGKGRKQGPVDAALCCAVLPEPGTKRETRVLDCGQWRQALCCSAARGKISSPRQLTFANISLPPASVDVHAAVSQPAARWRLY